MALVTKNMSATAIASVRPLHCLNKPFFSLINLFNTSSPNSFNCSPRDFHGSDIGKKIITFEYDQLQCPLGHHPKYAADLPNDNIRVGFPTVRMVPSGIFRWTKQNVQGSKDAIYKNPEYFSYHQMSYYDMQLHTRKMISPKKLVALESLAIGVFIGPNDFNDIRKYGHQLPQNNVCPCFEVFNDIPSGVFRCTHEEILGLGAGKGCFYQNPEYFSYHHMSFFDFHLHLKGCRLPQPDSKRKPP